MRAISFQTIDYEEQLQFLSTAAELRVIATVLIKSSYCDLSENILT